MHIFAPNISDQQQLDTQCMFCDYSAALHSHVTCTIITAGLEPTTSCLGNKRSVQLSYVMHVATAAGFEPATHRLEGDCSVQLSYAVNCCDCRI